MNFDLIFEYLFIIEKDHEVDKLYEISKQTDKKLKKSEHMNEIRFYLKDVNLFFALRQW